MENPIILFHCYFKIYVDEKETEKEIDTNRISQS